MLLINVQVLVYCFVCYCEIVNCFKFPTDIRDFYYNSKRKLFGNDKPERIGIGQGEQSKITNSMPSKLCSQCNSNKQIPMSLLREINGVASLDEFMDRYVEGSTDTTESISLGSRFGESDGRSSSQLFAHAGCSPELKTIPLTVENVDVHSIIRPSCVRIERCGGCCDSVSECQPTSSEMVSAIVKVFKFNHDTSKFAFLRNEIVPLERHLKCECGCKLKPEHCLSYQKYHVEDCACKCNNTDEEEKCYENDKKVWDPDFCSCTCAEEEECSSGYYFDKDTCECTDEALTTRRTVSNNGPRSEAEIERIKQDRKKLILQLTQRPSDAN